MNLRDLRSMVEEYSYLPDETLILLSSDEEGNRIRTVDCINTEYYRDNPDEFELDLIHIDDLEGDEPLAIVFWP